MVTIKFKVFPEIEGNNLMAIAVIDKEDLVKVSLTTKVPRGAYYSLLNSALQQAEIELKKQLQCNI